MKTIRHHVTVFMVLIGLFGISAFLIVVSQLQRALEVDEPVLAVSVVQQPHVSAVAALIIDEQTGTVLYEKQADEALPIASVTKLVSSALFWGGVSPLATTTIVASDVRTDGRSGRLEAGQMYQNRELLFPALLESSNDAAVAMERTAPFDLVAAMNAYAVRAGATHTTFTDTSGLSDQNVSTARDLALLLKSIKKDYPHIIDITTLPHYLNHVNAWQNNNPFVALPGYQGGKHGYTVAANRTAVARFSETISGAQRTIDYVLLGSDDLLRDMAALRTFTASAASLK